MAKTIAFINMKGGVGKTTLAVNMAYALAKLHELKVLLIDIDPQMNSTHYCLSAEAMEALIDEPNRTIYGFLNPKYKAMTTRKNYMPDEPLEDLTMSVEGVFDIVPSHLKMMEIHIANHPFKLRQYINENFAGKYDVVILDCPPTISNYTKIGLLAADGYLVPMRADAFSMFGLPMLQEYVQEHIHREFDHKLDFVGVLLNMVLPNRVIYKKVKERLREHWGDALFTNEIPYREIIVKGLDDSLNKNKFMVDMAGDKELRETAARAARELMQRGRL